MMVFEPGAVPEGNHAAFADWYGRQTKWREDHGYDDPALSSDHLRAWFEDIVRIFPPMNGPYAILRLPENEAFEHGLRHRRRLRFYASFAWSQGRAIVYDGGAARGETLISSGYSMRIRRQKKYAASAKHSANDTGA